MTKKAAERPVVRTKMICHKSPMGNTIKRIMVSKTPVTNKIKSKGLKRPNNKLPLLVLAGIK